MIEVGIVFALVAHMNVKAFNHTNEIKKPNDIKRWTFLCVSVKME